MISLVGMADRDGDNPSEKVEITFALVVEKPLAMSLVDQHRLFVEGHQPRKQVALAKLHALLITRTLIAK